MAKTTLFTSLSDEQAQLVTGGRWTTIATTISGDEYKLPNGPLWAVDYTVTQENNGGKQRTIDKTYTGKNSDVQAFIAAYS